MFWTSKAPDRKNFTAISTSNLEPRELVVCGMSVVNARWRSLSVENPDLTRGYSQPNTV
jgi:hypothetical protein